MFLSHLRKTIFAITCLLLAGCTPKATYYTASQTIMDTIVEVKISGCSQEIAARGMEAVFNEFKRVDQLMSRFQPTSAVSEINNRAVTSVVVDPEVYKLLQDAVAISLKSGGAFDVTIAPALELYGFGTKEPREPESKELTEALKSVGYEKVHFGPQYTITFDDPATRIDLGGIAKGYALKTAAALLLQSGVNNFLLDAGGDLVIRGHKNNGSRWRIGIKNPRGADILGTMEVTDTAVVTSGDYERFFMVAGQRIHHILNPKTGAPASLCQSVTVSYPDATAADAYATAIFVLGPVEGLKLAESVEHLAALIVDQEGKVHRTKKFSYEAQ